MRRLQELVDAADVPALMAAVEGLCSTRRWDDLVDLARRCREAVELGKQLWPVAMHIDYRLAWEGPPRHAGSVLRPGAGRFALGPLTEVGAATHDWDSLAPHLGHPAVAAAVAQERVLRGEDLRYRAAGVATELPLVLADWEPDYALPRYRDRSAAFPQPEVATRHLASVQETAAAPRLADDDATRALRDVVETWVTESSGSAAAVAVEGSAAGAVGHLVPQAALQRVSAADAIALLQWAGASGGAHGRRRGGAAGRFNAWWAAAALAGVDWIEDVNRLADDLGAACEELAWYRWRPAATETGWTLRLAVEDPVDGLAWAIDATDHRNDDAGL